MDVLYIRKSLFVTVRQEQFERVGHQNPSTIIGTLKQMLTWGLIEMRDDAFDLKPGTTPDEVVAACEVLWAIEQGTKRL